MAFRLVRPSALLTLACVLQGCAFFGKPPLPKHASIEHGPQPPSATDFEALVAAADIIYFPDDRAASGARSEPAALLLEALQRSGQPLTIGWDLMDAGQQPLLDEIQMKPAGERSELLARLELLGSSRAREHCRAVLREAPVSVRQLALRCPPGLIVKVVAGDRPTPEEEKQLPRGYRAPEGGFQAYAERLSSQRGLTETNLAGSYRAQMFGQQFSAERIVRHFRAVGGDNKLLAFLSRSDLEEGHGVPAYVAQKLSLRQLVLGSEGSAAVRAKLLTRQSGSGFEIVDRTPAAGGD